MRYRRIALLQVAFFFLACKKEKITEYSTCDYKWSSFSVYIRPSPNPVIGSNFSIEAFTTGTDKVVENVLWTKPNGEQFNTKNLAISINNAKAEDFGTYKVELQNGMCRKEMSITVK